MFLESGRPVLTLAQDSQHLAQASGLRAVGVTLDDQISRFDEHRGRLQGASISRSRDDRVQKSRRLRMAEVPFNPFENDGHYRIDRVSRSVDAEIEHIGQNVQLRGCSLSDQDVDRLLTLFGLGRTARDGFEGDEPGGAVRLSACEVHASLEKPVLGCRKVVLHVLQLDRRFRLPTREHRFNHCLVPLRINRLDFLDAVRILAAKSA